MLNMEQKRELVYEMSKLSDGGIEMLQAWSRQEILQVLCAELGIERKYTGLTKSKLIEHLLKIVYEKKAQGCRNSNASAVQPSPQDVERTPKRQRKSDHPNHLLLAIAPDVDSDSAVFCKNSACKAKMNREDVFCKRCSCCMCHQYDDNKDPSLWLFCNSDPPFNGVSCGMSCHLECALRHENSGILQDRQDKGLDGSFCCVSCGKVNDLLGFWRKQLVVARDTRRVDILCYRLSLGQKILSGTKHYQNLYGIIEEAAKKLEEDMGPLTGLPVKRARGIVNRLPSGPEVQRLCASAVETLDLMLSNRVSHTLSDCRTLASNLVRFEDLRASSLVVILNFDDSSMGNVVGYSLWHRKADDIDYPAEPTCRLFKQNTKFLLPGLTPDTQYFLKVVALDTEREMGFYEFQFRTRSSQEEVPNLNSESLEVERSQSPATNLSSLSNPSSVEDETNNVVACSNGAVIRGDNHLPFSINVNKTAKENLLGDTSNCSDRRLTETTGDGVTLSDEEYIPKNCGLLSDKNKESSNRLVIEETGTDNVSLQTGLECVPYVDRSEAGLPLTPCKFENMKDDSGRRNQPKFRGKNIATGSGKDPEPQAGSSPCLGDKDYQYHVKVIRWLECDGHIETTFRQRFLTWYSLRATHPMIRIVKVFIDTFVEDPESLAGQLVDTFSDVISNKRCSTVPAGFCLKLWH